MAKGNKASGTRREYKVRDAYREDDWYAFRTRDDQSICDVVAMKAGHQSIMAEVKSNKEGGPYMNFRKKDRQALIDAARIAGAMPLLVYWPIGGKRQDIPADQWPK
jgi:hypothetical protein